MIFHKNSHNRITSSTKSKFTIFLFNLILTIMMTGCGGGGGGGSSSNSSGENRSESTAYYDSTKSDLNNLSETGKIYSVFNGQKSLEIRNIPVDPSQEVLYACLITNPNRYEITNLVLTPPLTYNIRANEELSEEDTDKSQDLPASSNMLVPFRENLVAKARLKEELYKKYLENEANNKKLSIRAAVNHQNEQVGQKDIIIKVLGKQRHCTFAKESNYAKIFIDQNSDGSVPAANISESSLQQLADEFDSFIYPILRDYFGNGTNQFWKDVDSDGKLSIVFSPVYNNYSDSVAGIFDTASMNDSNYSRDMIGISVKSGEKVSYEKWFMDARETVVHEMQHIVNFSAKSSHSEETWIDEGLSVCAEIIYRGKRREAGLMSYSLYYGDEILDFEGNDVRFYYASYYKPELSITNFIYNDTDTALAHYGQKGLFFYYLYEQYGKETIRKLCQGVSGTSKFSELDRSIGELSRDFNFASLNEKIRNIELSNNHVNPYYTAIPTHKFKTNMYLNFVLTSSGYFREITTNDIERKFNNLNYTKKINILDGTNSIPANGGTIRLYLKQPKNFSNLINSNNYTLTFDSSNPIVINMVRVTGN